MSEDVRVDHQRKQLTLKSGTHIIAHEVAVLVLCMSRWKIDNRKL